MQDGPILKKEGKSYSPRQVIRVLVFIGAAIAIYFKYFGHSGLEKISYVLEKEGPMTCHFEVVYEEGLLKFRSYDGYEINSIVFRDNDLVLVFQFDIPAQGDRSKFQMNPSSLDGLLHVNDFVVGVELIRPNDTVQQVRTVTWHHDAQLDYSGNVSNSRVIESGPCVDMNHL